MMGLWQSLAGMVDVEVTSAHVEGMLAAVTDAGISIRGVQSLDPLTVRFQIPRREYTRLWKLLDRRGDGMKIIRRRGLYWRLKSLLYRPVLTVGMCLLLVGALYLPSRICFVEVEGNSTLPDRQIMEAARNCGIRFGASRREVRSEKVKNELLSALPDLKWAGVNTQGCVALISVRERTPTEDTEDTGAVSSIAAARDGIIISCTATKGNLLCREGQAVRQGQILISGYTDCGLTVTATRAEGEILAQTRRRLTAVTPLSCEIPVEQGRKTVKYSLLIGKKRINFYKGSGIWDATCGKMYAEYHLTLPGGFQLPVTLVRETAVFRRTVDQETDSASAGKSLTDFAEDYLRRRMIAGTIFSRDCIVQTKGDICCLTGEFSCTEMIGTVCDEKIGEYNGKTS